MCELDLRITNAPVHESSFDAFVASFHVICVKACRIHSCCVTQYSQLVDNDVFNGSSVH